MKKLLPIYITHFLRLVAVTLFSTFSTIYIYKEILAQSGNRETAFLGVVIFYLIYHLAKLIGFSLAENLAQKTGLETQMLLGHLLTIFTFVAFILSRKIFYYVWSGAVLWGLAASFYWFGKHGLMIKIATPKRFGRSLGVQAAIENSLLILLPFIGGLIISELGYQTLFWVAILIMLGAIVFLDWIPSRKTHQDVTLKEIWQLMLAHKPAMMANFRIGAIDTISVALTLYIFIFLKKEIILGSFLTLSQVLVALVDLAKGEWIDRGNKKSLIFYGSLGNFFVWLGRFVVKTIRGLFVLNVAGSIAGGMVGTSLEVTSYQKALDGHSTGRAIMFRELAINIGAIITSLVMLVLIPLGLELKSFFIIAAMVSLIPLWLVKNDE